MARVRYLEWNVYGIEMEMVVIPFFEQKLHDPRNQGGRGNPPFAGFGCSRNKTFWLKMPSSPPFLRSDLNNQNHFNFDYFFGDFCSKVFSYYKAEW